MEYIVSLLPIALLFVLMLGFRLSGWLSALLTLVATVLLALFAAPALGLIPERFASEAVGAVVWWSVAEGVLKALMPIFLIILMAIFSYNVLVESGQIEVIKRQFISLTSDRGILVLLMVWGFGGLLEGMAGFGTAVAIPAAILIGLGFKPFFSALVALLGNTVATGFAAVGVPVTTLCSEASTAGAVSAEMLREVSGFTVLQLAPLFLLVPFAILMLTDSKAWLKNALLALWVGVVSLAVQFVCAWYFGPETPAIIGSLAAIAALMIAARVIDGKRRSASGVGLRAALRAWSVYICILLLVVGTGAMCPPVQSLLKSCMVSEIYIPVLGSVFRFAWLQNAALMLLLGSIVGGLIQGLSPAALLRVLGRMLVGLRFTAITIVSLIAMAAVMNSCGMIATIAAGLVALTGGLYPLFAPLIGAIGTFVTGSDTSSNILFAKLQTGVAHQLGLTGQGYYFGLDGSQTNWLLSANTTGATGGKMLSPQSIAVATAACDMKGSDAALLRAAIPYALAYVLIGGLMVYCG